MSPPAFCQLMQVTQINLFSRLVRSGLFFFFDRMFFNHLSEHVDICRSLMIHSSVLGIKESPLTINFLRSLLASCVYKVGVF